MMANCNACGKPGAEKTWESPILGCEYDVHEDCLPEFKIEMTEAEGRYFYGDQ